MGDAREPYCGMGYPYFKTHEREREPIGETWELMDIYEPAV